MSVSRPGDDHDDVAASMFPDISVKAALMLVVVGYLLWFLLHDLGAERREEAAANDVNAWLACQDFIDDLLFDPETAVYTPENQMSAEQEADTWTIRGWVVADDSAGDRVRRDVVCHARYLGDREWQAAADLQ